MDTAIKIIQQTFGTSLPKIAMILGTGLSGVSNKIIGKRSLPYEEIPGFPVSTVQDHPGILECGTLEGVPVLVLNGRFHYYEGYSMEEITYPIRVLKQLGIEMLILTNASGSLRLDLRPGELGLICDHIKLSMDSPQRGRLEGEGDSRFQDMTDVYSSHLRLRAKEVANKVGVSLEEVVYLYTGGPSFETPAEIRMYARMGGDVVGMSTVPEAITAKHLGMQILGISAISNYAAGLSSVGIHEEMKQLEQILEKKMISLLCGLMGELA